MMVADWVRWGRGGLDSGRWVVRLYATEDRDPQPEPGRTVMVSGHAPWGPKDASARLIRRLAGGPNIGMPGWTEIWSAQPA